jgi:uroporphyrinogen-III synthase
MSGAEAIDGSLAGRRIAVPESRELDVFAALLERRGATVLRCPLVDIRDAPDPAPLLDWLRGFNAGGCDDLVLFTGEGLRRLLGVLERHAPGERARFVERLAQVRIVARGPKPGRVLRELGLRPDVVADPATTPGVIACLRGLDLRGRRVGVQLYGAEPNEPLMAFLAEAGAQAQPVAPYRYADAADDAEVLALVERMRQGEIDAIAFTSLQQVERLFRLAQAQDRQEALLEALSRTVAAAVGPLVADALERHGVRAQAVPTGSYYMKPLVTALTAALAAR